MTLGETITFYRRKRKLTQEQLAEKSGTCSCYISRIENNHDTPSLPKLKKIATALKVQTWMLFYGAVNESAQQFLVALNECSPSENAELCANLIAMKENMRAFRDKA